MNDPLPIRQGDRRFAVFDTNPEKRGDLEYFETLSSHLEKEETKWAFYQLLKTMNTYDSPIQFQKSIPITAAYRDIRLINAPLYHKWLLSCLSRGTLKDASAGDLYNDFKSWISENREKQTDIISLTAFGLLLTNTKSIQTEYNIETDVGNKSKKHGIIFMHWNVDGLVEGFKKLHLLEPDFAYGSQSDADDT